MQYGLSFILSAELVAARPLALRDAVSLRLPSLSTGSELTV